MIGFKLQRNFNVRCRQLQLEAGYTSKKTVTEWHLYEPVLLCLFSNRAFELCNVPETLEREIDVILLQVNWSSSSYIRMEL